MTQTLDIYGSMRCIDECKSAKYPEKIVVNEQIRLQQQKQMV